MEIILLENILNLGNIGDKVKVKNGFGRNFLLRQGKALRFNKENQDLVNKKKVELNKKNIEIKNKFKEIAKLVDKKNVSRWGILSLIKKKKNYFKIKDVIEKPSIKKAPSNYAIIGRYILPSKIFTEIKKLKPGQGGEIHITDAIKNLIYKGEKFFGNIFIGKYLDCGTISGYIQSSVKIFKGQKWNYAW